MKYNFREHPSSTHIDYQTRVSLTKFHPKDNVIATSVNNNLYIFNGFYSYYENNTN